MSASETDGYPNYPLTEIVCVGAVVLTGGKQGMAWREVKDGELVGEEFYTARKMVPAQPGAVWQIRQMLKPEGERSFLPGRGDGLRWLRTWPDDAQVLAWRTMHEVTMTRERADKAEKVGKDRAMLAALRPLKALREAYLGTDRRGRVLIEAQVLQFLRDGRL